MFVEADGNREEVIAATICTNSPCIARCKINFWSKYI